MTTLAIHYQLAYHVACWSIRDELIIGYVFSPLTFELEVSEMLNLFV